MEQYQMLRKQYPRFFYRGYEIEETNTEYRLTYQFEIEGLSSFCPGWRFPKAAEDRMQWSKDRLMQDMAFFLGMVELISYWKITCSPDVIVEAGYLNEEQIRWWKDLYFNGLGEFFYVNNIDEAEPSHFMEITCSKMESALSQPEFENESEDKDKIKKGVMVPIGGGKDSAVSLELLKSADVPLYAYIINSRGATDHTAQAAGLDSIHTICVRRTLDSKMLDLNKQGFLNGHTPFSALVAFSSIIAARMLGLSYIALSNESSANESTVKDSTVNHQYSKSFKFEKDFHQYQTRFLPGSAFYFSLLRPLSEFQIARYFAGKEQYHSIFRSCNVGSKTDSWCGHCPKCLFVFLILSPFLSREKVREIFGRDMLEDLSLTPVLEQLTGLREEKPFECVGSRDEINTAIVMTIQRLEQGGEDLPALLSYYKSTELYGKWNAAENQYFNYFDEENLVPEVFKRLVRKSCTDSV